MAINMSATLLAGLFGQQGQASLMLPFGNAAPAASAGDAVVAFRRVTKVGEEDKGLAREKKDPVTLTALAQFRQALDAAPNIDKALSDPRVLKVLMPALGLPDQVGNPGMIKRALLSDPNDPKGVAAQLGTTWKNAAATLNLKATATPKTVAFEGLTDKEITNIAGQLRMGEAILTASASKAVTPKVRAFDGLADKVTTALIAQLRPGETAVTTRASREVGKAAALAAATIRKAEVPAEDLPTIAKDALTQIASLMGNGSFGAAVSVVDQALTALDGATGLTPTELRQGRLALMEGGIALEQLRRDPFAVAKRLEKLVALDSPDDPLWAPAYKAKLDAFHKEGVENNSNFALEVAAAMGQRMRDGTNYPEEMDLAKSYIDRSMNVLSTRDGRPTKTPIDGVPIARITQADVTKFLDVLKNAAPPSQPRAQLEVNYAANAALSAIKLGESPLIGIPTVARNALKEMVTLVRAGSFSSAIQRLDDALVAIDEGNSLPAITKREAKAALLQASISLEQVRRNADGVAERMEKLAALETPERAVWSQTYQLKLENFHMDGVDGNVNFALEVAAAMANRMLTKASTLDEQLQAQSLFTRSQQILSGRDGRPPSLSGGVSQARILPSDAGKVVDVMKQGLRLGSLSDPKMLEIVTNGFTKYEYRTGLSAANPGMANAVYFAENAKTVKNAYDILGNGVMRRVVMGALGLPDQIAIQPVEAQARAVTSRLKIADLQNPAKVRALAERYLMAEAEKAAGATANTGSSPLAMISGLSIKV
ncbi:MAG: DUF1217 domain-containing protein [Roseomonas sp.]|nr:DUF1217 domain-containing protein [Roseomonas sp.]MCA3396582.1 DUF1217 domain-containing protein [Roseomonas sp.]